MSLEPVEALFRNLRLETLQPDRDAPMIIRTVLTYGSWDQIEWLFSQFEWERVREVVLADIRGMKALPESVRAFWANVFEPELLTLLRSASADRWRQTRLVPEPPELDHD